MRTPGRPVWRSTTVQLMAALALVAVYSAVLVYQGPKGREVYPVFKWELFSQVPDRTKSDYSFRITAVDGQPLFLTPYFESTGSRFPGSRSPDAFHLTRSVGLAVERGDDARADAARARFEARYFAGKQVSYELVARTYDTLERVSCGCYTQERVVASYEYDG